MSIQPEVWFPVVTLVLGAVLTVFSDWRRAQRDSLENRIIREEERVRALLLEQREVLLQITEAVPDFARVIWQIFMEDKRNSAKNGAWAKGELSQELNERAFLEARKLPRLSSRLLDERLRNRLVHLNAAYAEITTAKDEMQAAKTIDAMSELVVEIQIGLGAAIREIDMVSFKSGADMAAHLGLPSSKRIR